MPRFHRFAWFAGLFVIFPNFAGSVESPTAKQIPILVRFMGGEQWVVGSIHAMEKKGIFEIEAPSVGFRNGNDPKGAFSRPSGKLEALANGKEVPLLPAAAKKWSLEQDDGRDTVELNPICEAAKKCLHALPLSQLLSMELRPLPTTLHPAYAQAALRWTHLRFGENTLRYDVYSAADGNDIGFARPHPNLTLSEFSELLFTLSRLPDIQSFADTSKALHAAAERLVRIPADLAAFIEEVDKAAACETKKARELQVACLKAIFPGMELAPNLFYSAQQVSLRHLTRLLTAWDAYHLIDGECPSKPAVAPQWFPLLKASIDQRLRTREGWVAGDRSRRENLHHQRLTELKKKVLGGKEWSPVEFKYAIRGAAADLNPDLELPSEWVLPDTQICPSNEGSPMNHSLPKGWVDRSLVDALFGKQIESLSDLLTVHPTPSKSILREKFSSTEKDLSAELSGLEKTFAGASSKARMAVSSALANPGSPFVVLHRLPTVQTSGDSDHAFWTDPLKRDFPRPMKGKGSKKVRARAWAWFYSLEGEGAFRNSLNVLADGFCSNPPPSLRWWKGKAIDLQYELPAKHGEFAHIDVEWGCEYDNTSR
jgi:hypothetical protein